MPLAPGTRLGPYEIAAPLGAGGMGEVYRARDSRLGREVAVKVLPGDVAGDAERLRRFEQEARAVSALNHPNILTVFDVGAEASLDFLVTELLDGETLRDLVARGPVSLRSALDIAAQAARGLAAAHEAGVIHRDIKPENLFVTRDGRVKILDFGLARLEVPELAASEIADASTIVETRDGTLLGTVGYMAPEQVRGERADARSDLFALGVVLHELLAGANPFRRGSVVESLNAVLKEEAPPLPGPGGTVPSTVQRLLARLLEKAPERRFRSAADLAFSLDSVVSSDLRAAVDPAGASSPSPDGRRRAWLAALLAAVAGVAIGSWIGVRFFAQEPSPIAARFDLAIPPGAFFHTFAGPPAISPDGRHIVVSVFTGGNYRLALRSLAERQARLLPETVNAQFPFWSPDSRSIGFWAFGELRVVDLAGGSARTICAAPGGGAMAAWGADDSIVFGGFGAGLQRVASGGGKPMPLTELRPARHEIGHLWPAFLADGRRLIFLARSARPEMSRLEATSLDGQAPHPILDHSTAAVVSPTGHLLIARRDELMAVAIDRDRLTTIGEPFRVERETWSSRVTSGIMASISNDGTLVFATAGNPQSRLVWRDRAGREVGTVGAPGEHLHLDLAPDGRSVVVESIDPETSNAALWRYDLARGVSSRLTLDSEWHWSPRFAPDGARLAFGRGTGTILVQASDGATPAEIVTTSDTTLLNPTGWSPDVSTLLLAEVTGEGGSDIVALTLGGKSERRAVVATRFDESQGTISPDGAWLAYTSNESGRLEVYVRPYPSADRKWQLSTEGGDDPRWAADGDTLYYIAADRKLMAVTVTTRPEFGADSPRTLFATRARGYFDRIDFAVDARGERFLVNDRLEGAAEPTIHVVTDLTRALRSAGAGVD